MRLTRRHRTGEIRYRHHGRRGQFTNTIIEQSHKNETCNGKPEVKNNSHPLEERPKKAFELSTVIEIIREGII